MHVHLFMLGCLCRCWHCRWCSVDMFWAIVAEEPRRSAILNLEHCPLKANVSCVRR